MGRCTAARAAVLISQTLTNWSKTRALPNNHASLKYHEMSMAKLQAFHTTYEAWAARIDCRLTEQMAALVHRNRNVLKSVIKWLTLCARQGLALRGHRDDSTSEALNKGNFLAVVEFRRELDTFLDEHLRSGPRNSTMISKTVQNDLLHFMEKFVARTIIEEVDASLFVAVLADEVTDISNWEQLGVAVRYIKDNAAQEKLLVVSQVEQTDGKSICQVMQHELSELGIDLSRCTAQAYDGGGNMSGRLRGCQAIFREKYPSHCTTTALATSRTWQSQRPPAS